MKLLQVGWRWALVALAGAVVVLAGAMISSLRSEAVSSRKVDQRLRDVRYLVSDAEGAGWQIVAEGGQSSTFSRQIDGDVGRIAADLRFIRHATSDEAGVRDVLAWVPAFDTHLTAVEGLVGAGRRAAAGTEMLLGVDGTAQVIQRTVRRLSSRFSLRSMDANKRLYDGSLITLGAAATLVALLASAFTLGHRRELAAERAALERSERRFRALVQRASEVVLVCDASRCIRYVTEPVHELLGRRPQELIGVTVDELLPADERDRACQMFHHIVTDGPHAEPSEWTLPRPDGAPRVIEVRSSNLLHDPDIAGIVLTVRDVTARRDMEARLRHQALHDPLTGLTNRTLFEDRVSQALQRCARQESSVAVLYLDLDGFKAINDSLGHFAGDELLRTVAARIDECLRGAGTAGRLGGDEFACLLEGIRSREDALATTRRLTDALERPVMLSDRPVSVRASIGIAYGAGDTIDAEELIRHADLAMYKAKAEHQGETVEFDQDLLVAARHRLELREDLERALGSDQLTLDYQPIVDLDSAQVTGLEALLRWRHPTHGMIPPDRFIPIAEDSGLIVDIGRWVVDRALAELVGFSSLAPDLRINVNVAPRELVEDDYVQSVADALARHGIAPERLTLELTESELLDADETARRIGALAKSGVRMAIDDFGTGQSSLARLQDLPVTQVKIDRSFMARIDENALDATLVRSILDLGQALGLQMVVEGVERDTQVELLRDSRCRLAQGFFFARSHPANEISALLGDGGSLRRPAPAMAIAD
jgi:diguanylate cyclase (GGDEF)-like protein/PAS domain S-box-containing protein